MLSTEEFENLLERSESTILDFKTSMYDFNDDVEFKSTAKYIKDIVSFCNTVRSETSFIIVGVEEKDGKKLLHGLNQSIDDSILQQKAKDKVYPRPIFKYYTLSYQNKTFGIFEFPKMRYSVPVHPVVKMKGLEIGKVYYRQGSSNTEALALEVIKINDWLKSLPEFEHYTGVNEEVNKLLNDLTSNSMLSKTIADMYTMAEKYKLPEILTFCLHELKGFDGSDVNNKEDKFAYRLQKVLMSLNKLEFNPYHNIHIQTIKNQIEKSEDFFEFSLMFSHSIIHIEQSLKELRQKSDNTFGTMKLRSKDIFGDNAKSDYTIYAYLFSDTYNNLHTNIRQRAIDLLMKVK